MMEKPLVSCVMPTADRAAYLPLAIKCFLAQTYAHRELIIFDTGKIPIEHLVPVDARIVYCRDTWAPRRPGLFTLGGKRNAACGMARGSIAVNWDDDDWYAPTRIEFQVERLLSEKKMVTGFHRFFYWNESSHKAYEYIYTGAGSYASGSTQCYRLDWWKDHKFPSLNSAEDSEFSFLAAKLGVQDSVEAGSLMVARGHSSNTWKQPFGGRGFPERQASLLPVEFFRDIGSLA
jgi:glycosyltransferase involved in cell wall biosynthesis